MVVLFTMASDTSTEDLCGMLQMTPNSLRSNVIAGRPPTLSLFRKLSWSIQLRLDYADITEIAREQEISIQSALLYLAHILGLGGQEY